MGDIDFGRPQDGVDDGAPERRDLEVAIEVPQCGPVRAASIRAVIRPANDDVFPFGRHLK